MVREELILLTDESFFILSLHIHIILCLFCFFFCRLFNGSFVVFYILLNICIYTWPYLFINTIFYDDNNYDRNTNQYATGEIRRN